MKSKHTQKILSSDQQCKDLELIVCRRKSALFMVLRAKIILAGAEGKSLQKTSQDLECNRETVTRWRKHWVERSDDLSVLERLKEAPCAREIILDSEASTTCRDSLAMSRQIWR